MFLHQPHFDKRSELAEPLYCLFDALEVIVALLPKRQKRVPKRHSLAKNGNAPYDSKALFFKSVTPKFGVLCFVELFLSLFAAGAAPVVGQVFKGHSVVLGRVIHIAAN